jgi:RAB protein geranylgeranyltransferase component A
MVDLLVLSNISRYLSFKNITRLVCVDNWRPVEIPFSRQSVFLSTDISLVEKRLLMRFMQVCAEKEKNADQLQQFASRPFVDLMEEHKLTPLLQNLILDCIVMASSRELVTERAIESIQRFITSTGVYGNTPFLVSTHGSGEMQQAFCRLSAVFGATYWLANTIQGVVETTEVEAGVEHPLKVMFESNEIECKYLVSGAACTPTALLQPFSVRSQVSRAILITNKSVKTIVDKTMINREVSLTINDV